MRDPRLGAFGVLAVVLSLLVRTGALSALGGWTAVAATGAAGALSRAASAAVLGAVPPATPEGLGAAYGREVTGRRAAAAVVAGAVLGGVAIGAWAAVAVAVAAAPVLWVVRASGRRIGGITGDVLGAVQQVAEIAVLLVVAAVAHAGSDAVPW
jgi:adenosylcobinamide-GDP ribazoletransferase